MTPVEPQDLDALLGLTRDLAQMLAARHPGLRHCEFILERVEHASSRSDARATFEALRPLGVFAAREFDGAEGDYAQMADAMFKLCYAARKRAGLSDWE